MDFLLEGINSVYDAVKSKAFSKIGDSLANLIFSLSQAKYSSDKLGRGNIDFKGTPKVSAKILKNALAQAKESTNFPISIKGDAHAIGDAVEAIIAYAWVTKLIIIEESVEMLSREINAKKPEKLREEWEAYANGFSRILESIFNKLQQ
ncbi:MAG: ribonuclease III family protein [Candidatus Hodarchaeota archaeon]